MDSHQSVIFDISISARNMAQTIEFLSDNIQSKKPTQVITANPIMIMAALNDPKYKEMMQQAELIVPDGAGLVWAAKYMQRPVQERVAGIDLMLNLLSIAEQQQWRVYFLGASQEVIQTAVANIRKQFPSLYICGYRDGYFGLNEDQQVIEDIQSAAPHLLFVGRAASQQEPWIHHYKNDLAVPVMMGVGGSFDVLSGKLKRAPKIWQWARLEWLYRLLQEPWRYKRMLDLPKFVWTVIKQKK